MDYKVVLSPALGITAEQFAAAWNAASESREAAQIRLEKLPGESFDPLADATIAVLTGIVGNTIYDIIKAKVLALRAQKHPAAPPAHESIKIIEQDQPDGSRIVVVTIEEE